jgi:hypothetical protein
LGAFTQPTGAHFGGLVKPDIPVWRPRPLFNNRIAFMTPAGVGDPASPTQIEVVQSAPGLIHHAPSACPIDQPLPARQLGGLTRGPDADAEGRPLCLATPGPCPDHHALMSGAIRDPGRSTPEPGAYGIYLANDDWGEGERADAARVGLLLLFDDPEFVDAEPVAVYRRPAKDYEPPKASRLAETTSDPIPLANGSAYEGTIGHAFNSNLYIGLFPDLAGQTTDVGKGPVFDRPPKGLIETIRIYASYRDRFDDPDRPRVPGGWELLLKARVEAGGGFGVSLPTGVPTVLAGFDQRGHVARWTTAPADTNGRHATLYAYAGDHYSGARAGGQTSCIGCHPGHSGMSAAEHNHAERIEGSERP